MELDHLIGLGVVVLVALFAIWLVWSCLCKGEDSGDDVESHDDEEVKSVNSRTRVISKQVEYLEDDETGGSKPARDAQPRDAFLKQNQKRMPSGYVQCGRDARFADPFGEWKRNEKVLDDTQSLSGIKSYRKSPVLPHRS